jgi:hypothetical protein
MILNASIEAWLRQQNLTPASLLGSLGVLGPNETVLVTGSIAAGYANSLSDIELLLLGWNTWTPPEGSISYEEAFVFQLESGQQINVMARSEQFLAKLSRSVLQCKELMDHPCATAEWRFITPDEFLVLWQLYVGCPLQHSDLAARYHADLCVQELPEHATLMYLMDYYAAREDAIGQLRDGHTETTLLMLRSAAHWLAEATLASLRDLAIRNQWVLRRLTRHESTLGQEQIAEHTRGICLWPDGDIREHVHRATQFGDAQIMQIFRRMPRVAAVCKVLGHSAPTVLYF